MTSEARLLVFGASKTAMKAYPVGELPRLLEPGDVLVLNDAATLPASLSARTAAGSPVELRLLALRGAGARRWTAVLFGDGDFHTPTEHRPPPPAIAPGDRLIVSEGLTAKVEAISPLSSRLLDIDFECDEADFWHLLYRCGRPVQYAHTSVSYELWDVQTPYASRPWAAEMPSAGYHLNLSILRELEKRGVGVRTLTHAAGLSATGDAELDDQLPLPERFDIPRGTVEAVEEAHRSGHRVIAGGTTVLRALEGCQEDHGGKLVPGPGVADLRIGPAFQLKIAAGLLTGIHERSSSHFRLLTALADPTRLDEAYRYAEQIGLRGHELGDLSLVWAKHC